MKLQKVLIKRKCLSCKANAIIESIGREFYTKAGHFIKLSEKERAICYQCPNGHNSFLVINI